MHPGAGHTWGKCCENACNHANNNNRNNAQGAGGGQCRGRQQPQQRGEAQGHFVETITMEQEDVSELPRGPTEVSDPAPIVQDEEEQLIVDEPAPCAAAAESFPAFSFTTSLPSVDSTGRPTPVHRTWPSQWGASFVPPAQATRLLLHSQWGHHKPPSNQMVPSKETPKPSAAPVKKAPPVAAPQPPKDETPAPPETGNGEYLLPVFHFSPFGTAAAMQETHHLDLFSFTDSFLEQSLNPYKFL